MPVSKLSSKGVSHWNLGSVNLEGCESFLPRLDVNSGSMGDRPWLGGRSGWHPLSSESRSEAPCYAVAVQILAGPVILVLHSSALGDVTIFMF